MQQESDPYVLPVLMSVPDRATADDVLTALQQIIDRHDVLRTAICTGVVSSAAQIVLRRAILPVNEISPSQESPVEAQMHALLAAPHRMSLGVAPLLHVHLAEDRASQRCFIVLSLHHVIADHVALEIIQHEIVECLAGRADLLPSVRPYRDFVAHALRQVDGDDAKAYFERILGDVSEPTAPFDLFDVHGDGSAVIERHKSLDVELAARVREVARRSQVSPAVLFHVAWALVVGACSNRDDVIFGTVLSGRLQGISGVADAPGMFINTLPVRVTLSGKSVAELVAHVSTALHHLLPYEQTSLALAQRCSDVVPGTPLFTAALNYRHTVRAQARGQTNDESNITILSVKERTNYPFFISVDDLGEDFALEAHIHDGIDAMRVLGYVEQALDSVATALLRNPEQAAVLLEIIPDAERTLLLRDLNATHAAYPDAACLHELFERQAMAAPDNIALVVDELQLSYSELNARANRLAHHLRTLGVGADSLVGLCIERSVEMMVCILGILKAGGAYVPLDPDYPQSRLVYMAENSGLALLLTQRAQESKVSPLCEALPGLQALYVDSYELDTVLQRLPDTDPSRAPGLSSDSLAYVIHTSGSTGMPKGVLSHHRGVVNRMSWMCGKYPLAPEDVVLQKTPYSFDVSLWEMSWPLITGARLVMARPHGHKDAEYIAELIDRHGVTTVHFVPSMLASMLTTPGWASCKSVRQVFCSGEALSADMIRRHYAQHDATLHNLYGPTEAAIEASYWDCDPGLKGAVVPIGKPIQNVMLHVLGSRTQLQPIGVAGELYIGGIGLARGYLNRPDLTDERFIANPYHEPRNPISSERLYKTGDLVRYLADGNIQYLGRIDDQVKIRGCRIELGEIEHSLKLDERVEVASVVARSDGADGEPQLVAYMTIAGGGTEAPGLVAELKARLQGSLPDYMVPALYVVLDAFPMTTSGKIDKKALPAPRRHSEGSTYRPPATPTELRLSRIWGDLLGFDAKAIGADDNFFVLGGHSLHAIRAIAEVRRQFGVELGIKDLFNAPSLAVLAALIDGGLVTSRRARIVPARDTGQRLPLSYAQQRLWLLDRMGGGSAHYNMPVALAVKGYFDRERAREVLARVIARHEPLRTVFADAGDEPWQVIRDGAGFTLVQHDLRHLAAEAQTAAVQAAATRDAAGGFDLADDLMLRASYLCLADDQGVLLFNIHHIAADGWSIGVLVKEFCLHYIAMASGREATLEPLTLRYTDYAQWQREWLASDLAQAQLGYWERQLSASPSVHSLPLDHARPERPAFRGARHRIVLGPATSAMFEQLARQHDLTLFMLLHGAISVLLSRHGAGNDIVLGTAVANRPQAELEDLIGFFVNTLVLRVDCSGNPRFMDYLEHVKAVNLDAQANQDVPFDYLVEHLKPARSAQYGPLVQIMFSMDTNEALPASIDLDECTLVPLPPVDVAAKFDLMFNASESADGLVLSIDYNTDLFEAASIARMGDHLVTLLDAIVAAPETPIQELSMVASQERDELLQAFDRTDAAYPRELCVHELFEQQAAAAPDAIA
ncbi:amino acid adenylation domain-containing protein, partial [Massilia sp.]|uniref:amino acid adenylation domain-containing protein n=1 Tax=Massilia sp. TaxID=1882437 RepID=UPI00352E87D2